MSDSPAHEPIPTLYEWAGGDEALARMIDSSTIGLSTTNSSHRCSQAESQPSTVPTSLHGGKKSSADPRGYTEDHGGYEQMLNKHRNLGITIEQRRRFVATMSIAADDAGLPDDPEFRSALLDISNGAPASPSKFRPQRRGRPPRARCLNGDGVWHRPIDRNRAAEIEVHVGHSLKLVERSLSLDVAG